MKQHITARQFHELSHNNQDKIKSWVAGLYQQEAEEQNPMCFVSISPLVQSDWLLNIGQMIEFLDEHSKDFGLRLHKHNGKLLTDIDPMIKDEIEDEPELCDALWEAVKEILEKK